MRPWYQTITILEFYPASTESYQLQLKINSVNFQSLRSKGYVKEQFAWQHYYWYLENDGITFLRDYLHLPQEIVPSTLKRPTARTTTAPPKPKPQGMSPCLVVQKYHLSDDFR